MSIIDYTTDEGRVRLLIADTDTNNLVLDDDQILGFLEIHGGNLKRAAAAALDTIASSEALLSKKIRTQDHQTDGPAVADALRAHARALRDEADGEDTQEEESFFLLTEPLRPTRVQGEEWRF